MVNRARHLFVVLHCLLQLGAMLSFVARDVFSPYDKILFHLFDLFDLVVVTSLLLRVCSQLAAVTANLNGFITLTDRQQRVD